MYTGSKEFEAIPFICFTLANSLLAGLILYGIIVSIFENLSDKDKEGASSFFPNFLGIFLILMRTILLFPISYLSTQVFICEDIQENVICYSEIHIFLICIGILNLIILIFTQSLVLYYFYDYNPKSNIPWALSDKRLQLIFNIKIMASAFIYSIDPYFKYSSIYLIFFIIADIFILYIHAFSESYLFKYIQFIEITGISILLLTSIQCILQVILEMKLNIHLIIFLFSPFFTIAFFLFKEDRISKLISQMHPLAELSQREINELSYNVLRLINSKSNLIISA